MQYEWSIGAKGGAKLILPKLTSPEWGISPSQINPQHNLIPMHLQLNGLAAETICTIELRYLEH